jgi:hypothetical protein
LLLLPALAGCSDPSKSDALAAVKRDVKEDAICILPAAILTRLKMQYTTKAACAPLPDDPLAKDPVVGCLDALVAAGATKNMPPGYLSEWPDEVASVSLDSLPAYDRRARALMFKSCVEMRDLREGRFRCGEATAEKVVHIAKGSSSSQVRVTYSRTVTLDPSVPAVEAACGALSHPAPEDTVTLSKNSGRWALATDEAASIPSR